jgi:3-phenylpropionate/cinnamic acid dioxygenase small subunit
VSSTAGDPVGGDGEDAFVRAEECGSGIGGEAAGAVSRHDANRMALRQLCVRYAAGVDGRDLSNFLDTFAGDAEVRVYEPPGTGDRPDRAMSGHSEIGLIVQRIAYYSRTIHLIGSCSFDVDGDRASGRVDCVAHHFLPSPQEDIDRMMHVLYEDGYRRDVQGEWRIAERNVRILDRQDIREQP